MACAPGSSRWARRREARAPCSPTSTPIIRELAGGVDAAFVFECARANGDIVSSRKGIVDARITIHGRAAHAGVEPENVVDFTVVEETRGYVITSMKRR